MTAGNLIGNLLDIAPMTYFLLLLFQARRSSLSKTSVVAKRSDDAPVTMQGWLYKQGSDGLMLWKKRWFVLSEYCLFYYKGRTGRMLEKKSKSLAECPRSKRTGVKLGSGPRRHSDTVDLDPYLKLGS